MVLNNIEQLIEKYNNGETSLKEEQQLKEYFKQETVALHLEMYKPMFVYFAASQKETFTKEVSLNSSKNHFFAWISMAAVAVLMLGLYLQSPLTAQGDLGTHEDPELAFLEVKKSLELISTHFNKGASSINYLNEVENTTSLIFKK
ncbi:hypothetical protein [Oceanihabitans sediminis]|uniref:hypothetical protein n=1 Tax=Oceanihabitans sediminis TaxID=1812012 RepID=UPI003A8FDA5B